MIKGPEEPEEPVLLDDFKVGQTVKIKGLGEVTLLKADFADRIYCSSYGDYFNSGSESEYLFVEIRILNTTKSAINYHTLIGDIQCDYGDGYVFGGWYRQKRSDNDDARCFNKKDDSYEISPLYAGRYIIIVTLPNLCVQTQEPLSMTFKIGDNQFTYIHRK